MAHCKKKNGYNYIAEIKCGNFYFDMILAAKLFFPHLPPSPKENLIYAN